MTTYAETARKLADGTSAMLSDEDREIALRNAAPVARILLDACKDRDSACMMAISVARMMSTLALTRASEIGGSLDTLQTAYGLAAGMTAGSLALPDEGEPAEDKASVIADGMYL